MYRTSTSGPTYAYARVDLRRVGDAITVFNAIIDDREVIGYVYMASDETAIVLVFYTIK